jgi:hypothetical protein
MAICFLTLASSARPSGQHVGWADGPSAVTKRGAERSRNPAPRAIAESFGEADPNLSATGREGGRAQFWLMLR